MNSQPGSLTAWCEPAGYHPPNLCAFEPLYVRMQPTIASDRVILLRSGNAQPKHSASVTLQLYYICLSGYLAKTCAARDLLAVDRVTQQQSHTQAGRMLLSNHTMVPSAQAACSRRAVISRAAVTEKPVTTNGTTARAKVGPQDARRSFVSVLQRPQV
jgi:hypothetical protein